MNPTNTNEFFLFIKKAKLQLKSYKQNTLEEEVKIITKSLEEEEKRTIFDILSSRELKRALAITLDLIFFQQLSGITAVLFYTYRIFTHDGANLEPAICFIIVGIVQLL